LAGLAPGLIVASILEHRKPGKPYVAIADRMNANGVKPRAWHKWHPTQIQRVLQRVEANKLIRGEKGRLIGRVIKNGDVTYIRDGQGHLKGTHVKSADVTYDGQGHYVGNGDQLLRMLDK
jgi:uncharacterized protein YjlB